MKFRSIAFVFALALGTLVSCKDKETTVNVDETTTETTIEQDTMMVVPADTTAMPAETVPAQ